MSKTVLLPLLADGDYHSGEDLAQVLGVSRTAVWKQLNRLQDLGLELESVRGLGYRIPGGLDLLDAAEISAAMRAESKALLRKLTVLDSVDSTNAEAMRHRAPGSSSGLAYTAEQQSAGRGRRGRQWVSPFARNIYLSLVWEFSQGAAALEGLSLAVGVAVANALQACGAPPLQLKWPNDVLCNGAKLGGILLEMTGDAAGNCQVVVGVGLNVSMPESAAENIEQAWTDVARICGNKPPSRNRLLAALLDELLPLLDGFEAGGFAPWREAWMALDAYADTAVVLHSAESRQAGIARGVDERGALQLETTLGLQSIFGGEISMRPVA
ncbi:bifunctional biotin--[acetyl-CoA-carboxylase] ligase/biotin operon repressor BirA [Parahaliea sp. F7430]|uniref:Bifunctional ligase/repressor BirA n=1 Tax=Sediminihaliea albiluteola TaxID=2758564 RepID=A0A7W2YIH0_9GAMM|nr:bifunctional biotin--[acetyl-CoA-carboxylase] ligase/biotin operon repressor BirA [Sediminihaliea albiluteola]MBA6411529.1 bifunctional biotin--[acetyl-CoA-carboxylase] ligase/biotin operon repressor BirA [Sediminihaliea albiluteola]